MELVAEALSGNRYALARLISCIEDGGADARASFSALYPHTGQAHIVGVTGAPGTGKSTLVNELTKALRAQDTTVGVVAVDPSSPFTGGALLGDRVRMRDLAGDPGVFIRSMATRGSIGGLARATNDAVRIIEAMGMDVVIVETVGVGQDEIDVIQVVQTCLLVTTPGMGDDMQAMKAGVLEIADVIVLNKADLEKAEVSLKSLKMILDLATVAEGEWRPQLISTIAATAKIHDVLGIEELMAAIAAHQRHLQSSEAMMCKKRQRVAREINLIFQDQTQAYLAKALNGAGGKEDVLHGILQGKSDPYSVVKEIMRSFVAGDPD